MGKKKRAWRQEFDVAMLVLKDEPGALTWAEDDHVAFRYHEPAVRLVFYPHRTSAGHHHLRIRDEGSSNKARFFALADRLNLAVGFTCTFQVKNRHLVTEAQGANVGWAAQQIIGHWI